MRQQIEERIHQLHAAAPGSIGDQMQMCLLQCDAENGEFLFRCETQPWMCNAVGTLHGGMCAALLDQAMGLIAFCLKPEEGIAPTIQLQVNYHRPIQPGKQVQVKVRILSRTGRLIMMQAEAAEADKPGILCVSGTGTNYFSRRQATKNF